MEEIHLSVLLVEDDKENLDLLLETLSLDYNGYKLHFLPCPSFEEALDLLKYQRFDLVITDIFRDRADKHGKSDPEDALAMNIASNLRQNRFCPIVAFTDGTLPQELIDLKGPFFKLVDKTKNENIIEAINEIVATGIPQIANRLHRELDQAAGPSFLWSFLEQRWDQLSEQLNRDREHADLLLERLIRRRAAIQIGRLDPVCDEAMALEYVTAAEFYIMPPVSSEYRLGHVIKRNTDGVFFVILTPHCYLHIQPNHKYPRAEHVLIVPVLPFEGIIQKTHTAMPKDADKQPEYKCPWTGQEHKLPDKIGYHLKHPSRFSSPEGRYWFLPGFLDIPDSYCDFMQITSFSYESINTEFAPIAVIDTPFAESLQNCFTSFYGSIGLPELKPNHFMHLVNKPEGNDGQS